MMSAQGTMRNMKPNQSGPQMLIKQNMSFGGQISAEQTVASSAFKKKRPMTGQFHKFTPSPNKKLRGNSKASSTLLGSFASPSPVKDFNYGANFATGNRSNLSQMNRPTSQLGNRSSLAIPQKNSITIQSM